MQVQQTYKLIKFILAPTGQHHDAIHRPLVAVDRNRDISGELLTVTNGGKNLSAAALAGTVSQILMPSPQGDGVVKIEHGFQSRRMAFYMEIQHQDNSKQVLSGHTDHIGTGSRSIDPNMKFIFNQSIMMRENLVTRPGIGMTKNVYQTDNSLILAKPALTKDQIYGNTLAKPVTMRPSDVLNSFEAVRAAQALADSPHGGDQYTSFSVDTSNVLNDNSNLMAPVRSRVSNGITSNYVSKILTSYKSAMENPIEPAFNMDALPSDQAAGATAEFGMDADKFLFNSGLLENISEGQEVFFSDLMRVIPGVEQQALKCIEAIALNEMRNQKAFTRTDDYCGWGGSNWSTFIGSKVKSTLPGLMAELAITQAQVRITTCSHTSQLMVGETEGLVQNGAHVVVMSPKSFNTFKTGQQLAQDLEYLIMQFLVPDISDNFQTKVEVNANYDLFFESFIWVQYGDEPMVPYSELSNTSALSTSMIAPHLNYLNNVTQELSSVVAEVLQG